MIILQNNGRQVKKEGRSEIQKNKYLENEKSFLDEIKSISHSLWRAIIWRKNKNLMKIADTSFKNNTPLLYFALTYFIYCNWYLSCTLNFFSLTDIYFLSRNWSLSRKTATVVYSEMWLNRVIVHCLFLFDNLILYWVMFELLLFL